MPRESIDQLIRTHLEQAALAALASIIMPAVPCAANPITFTPLFLVCSHGDYSAHDLMSQYEILESSGEEMVTITYPQDNC